MALARFQEKIREYVSGGCTQIEQLKGDGSLIDLAFESFDQALANAAGKGLKSRERQVLDVVSQVMNLRVAKKDGQNGENVLK